MLIKRNIYVIFRSISTNLHSRRCQSTATTATRRTNRNAAITDQTTLEILGKSYDVDQMTNITPGIIALTERKIHQMQYHPLSFLKRRIRDYFYTNYKKRSGNPLHSFLDDLSPVVTVQQNFDSLLVPKDHVSRSRSDTYYINSDYLLRAHTSAHQVDLFKSGLDHFLVVGDVYRRDEINSSHFPCFHQMEGASIFSEHELKKFADGDDQFRLFESDGLRNQFKQASHTMQCSKAVELHLKSSLEGLVRHLFGSDVVCQWTTTVFPFTHPSWELEVQFNGKWLECLGCGIVEQELLQSAGAGDKVGWAFGLGLERLAMRLYQISDIRLFWSRDTGFLHQFQTDDYNLDIAYKAISKCPQLVNDVSFWLPEGPYSVNDFYDLVREIGGDLVEQVDLVDDFVNKKTNRRSHCYRIVYRHMERALTKAEVNEIQSKIIECITTRLGGTIR